MAWVKIDDQFSDHPKVLEVGPLAECLFVRGLTYASRYLTDGFVPVAHLKRMADLDAIQEADRLVQAGLWYEVEGGYEIHDYLDYQPSAEKVKAERQAARERMTKARAAKYDANEKRSSPEVRPNNARSSDNPVPSRPVPNDEVPSGTSGDGADAPAPAPKPAPKPRATRLPDDFTVTDEMRAWAHKEGAPDHLIDRETDKFCDYWPAQPGQRGVKLDWPKTWKNWMRRAIDETPRARTTPRNARPSGLDTSLESANEVRREMGFAPRDARHDDDVIDTTFRRTA